jgi:hypothetical protein
VLPLIGKQKRRPALDPTIIYVRDPRPGNFVVWRGWLRFIDIKIGAGLTCG